MPLTLIVTEGVLAKDRQSAAIARLSEAFLRLHGLVGNKFLTPNVLGHVQVVPADSTFSGSKPTSVAIIEWKTPSFAFTNREAQVNYVKEATDIIYELSDGKQPKDRIWVNVSHAVDGVWGIGGHAMTNEQLVEAAGKS